MKFSESGVKAIAHPMSWMLPKEPGCYLLVLNDEVIYVGQGFDVWRRSKDSQKYKCPDASIFVILHESKHDLSQAESALIRFFEPKMNGFVTRLFDTEWHHFLVRHGQSYSKSRKLPSPYHYRHNDPPDLDDKFSIKFSNRKGVYQYLIMV